MSTPVSSVSLKPKAAVLVAGETLQLVATVVPIDATDPSVTWESSNEDYATVDSAGLVTAVQEGPATITVTTVDGDFTDTTVLAINSDLDGAIYGEMLDFFPEDFISALVFDQDPLLNNGWSDPKNELPVNVIIQDGKTETKDSFGNIVVENHQFTWSVDKISQEFIQWDGQVYRLTFSSKWTRYGAFYAYEMDKLVGTEDSATQEPNWKTGGEAVI